MFIHVALYLKRLSDAVKAGDPIRAVIRGTAINANGKISGITQPSISGQPEVIMLEQPALRFITLDIGATRDAASVVSQISTSLAAEDDRELVWHDDLLHVSRFVADISLNGPFQQREAQTLTRKPLAEAVPAHLAIQRVGITDSIYFQKDAQPEASTPPPAGHVDIDLRAVSLNAKDIYTLSGKVETRKGTTNATDPAPGDRIVVLAPNHFRTTERVPAWACQKMLPEEHFDVMLTLPVMYGTALYALDDRTHLKSGESILVHSGAGAFGAATIALALQRGATVYTTVSTEAKKDYLVNEPGVPRENIFPSRDTSFVAGILAATNGRGVDVVVNSLTDDLLHATWDCCANFGRFVEVGKRNIVDAGKLDMRVFLRNVTFTAFDLTELYYHEDQFYRDIWVNKFAETLALYRSAQSKAVPIRTFDVADIAQAYRYFSTRDRVGKVVVSLENPASMVATAPPTYQSTFSPDKSYLLVGCLGGLGRSMSPWMFMRGTRHFTFLGRSGCDKPAARELVENLRGLGAVVEVVRGDVADLPAVEVAVAACPKPIGGVIQAAMGLHEALFSRMTHAAWHTGIQPKWRGSWNLHNALNGHDSSPDCFVVTSSVSGSVRTATKSNYHSANGFLDDFARHRRALGKPIEPIGLGMISEVGYLDKNPEIEALPLRKAIQPLNKSEFLQVLDLSLTKEADGASIQSDLLAAAHILARLEPLGIRKLLDQGFDVNDGTMQDPRSRLLSRALEAPSPGEEAVTGNSQGAEWAQTLPAPVVKAMGAEAVNLETLNEGIVHLVRKLFSDLLLLTMDKIDLGKPINSYGMDSMIAAEFRTWFYIVFRVDVPFLEVLNASSTLQSLSDMIEGKLIT